MSSLDDAPSSRRVYLTRVEESYLNVDGGRGWVDEYWSVQTNDGWTSLGELLHRKSIGEVTAIEERFEHLPAGRKFYRVVTIEAPIGTLVMHRVRRSELSGEQQTIFELRGEERLARPRSADAARELFAPENAPIPQQPVADPRKYLEALLAKLDGTARPDPKPPAPQPPSPGPVRRRRRPVELRLPVPPPEEDDQEETA